MRTIEPRRNSWRRVEVGLKLGFGDTFIRDHITVILL